MKPDEHSLKKGTAELLVLAQLEDEPRHGYDIALRIERRSQRPRGASPAVGSNAPASAAGGSTG
jgi:DNA-binding PadR family transcriptional regulator